MRSFAATLAIAIAAVAPAGCNQTQPQIDRVCTLEARAGITVTLTDESGAALPSSANARVVATDGAYADTARAVPGTPTPSSFSLAYERAGTYRVEASAAGHLSTTVNDVRVVKTSDDCHVVTQSVAIRLRRV